MKERMVAFLLVLVIGGAVFAIAGTLNPSARASYQSGDTATTPCLMYGMQVDGNIYPVLVNASGAVKTF